MLLGKKNSWVYLTCFEQSEGGRGIYFYIFSYFFSFLFYLKIMKKYTYLLNNAHSDTYFIDDTE